MSIDPRRSALVASAIVEMSAASLLFGLATAQALPPIPLAPACSFTGRFILNQSNGFRVEVPFKDTSISGSAVAFGSDSKAFSGGPATGSITGDSVDFTIDWDGPSKGKYRDTIDSVGAVSGTTQDVGQPGPTVAWDSSTRLVCVEAPPPRPAPKPVPASRTPTATVVHSDVDVYDEPGGDGNIIGILRLGSVVKVVKPCPSDDWCALADGRYVFGEFLQNN